MTAADRHQSVIPGSGSAGRHTQQNVLAAFHVAHPEADSADTTSATVRSREPKHEAMVGCGMRHATTAAVAEATQARGKRQQETQWRTPRRQNPATLGRNEQ
jgi:hypothetical protein